VIRSLKGRETMLWLNVTSRTGTYAPSAREGDAAALAAVGEVGDMARASGLRDLLARARPHLFAVSINGATNIADKSDRETIWKSLIQPLGQGTFDTYALLETLAGLGFEGPVGLQCYDVPGDKADILAQSMAAWRGYEDQMAR